ncbi:MAG: AAA family ATPase, partial [Bacteroidota bacterium]
MIRSLRISNFALIDELDLHLEPGFTVITGETGSGKSILLSALDLLTGERAD